MKMLPEVQHHTNSCAVVKGSSPGQLLLGSTLHLTPGRTTEMLPCHVNHVKEGLRVQVSKCCPHTGGAGEKLVTALVLQNIAAGTALEEPAWVF